ncbi:MAG: discoidin domain-containing protein [Bacteroidota bacterium]
MKAFATTLFLLFCFASSNAQIDCNSGRYYNSLFPNIKITKDIIYGNSINFWGSNEVLKLDIYEPLNDTETKRAFILLAHGGEFFEGTKSDSDIVVLSRNLAKLGYVVASINYRVSFLPFDATQAKRAALRACQDMNAAVRFIRKDVETNGNTYKIDTAKFFIGGTSAGGIMALHLAFLDKNSELVSYIDTTGIGDMIGKSGNPGFSQTYKGVINLSGALLNREFIEPFNNIPVINMHGSVDNVVPYIRGESALISGLFLDGSYEIEKRCLQLNKPSSTYSFWGQNHIPYFQSNDTTVYIDTVFRFVRNRLYEILGCTCSNPYPLPNTIVDTLENIAKNKPIYADDVQDAYYANLANDGLMNTRWSSTFSEPHFIVVDLVNSYSISKIRINWETAYASKYEIFTSLDSVQWQLYYSETAGNGAKDEYLMPTTARYIKINCTQRSTPYGFSIYELEVFGFKSVTSNYAEKNKVESFSYKVFPNPFDDEFFIAYNSEIKENRKAILLDAFGRQVSETKILSAEEGNNFAKFTVLNNLKSGIYVLKIESKTENRYYKIIKN